MFLLLHCIKSTIPLAETDIDQLWQPHIKVSGGLHPLLADAGHLPQPVLR